MDYVTETLVAVIWVIRNNQAMWYVHSGVVVLGFDGSPGPMLIRPAALLCRFDLSFLLQGMRYQGAIPLVLPLPFETVGNAGCKAIYRLLLALFRGRNR